MAATAERRRRPDGERSRQKILRAAASLATIDGLDGLSIGSLADHIGMSKSGLYAHFRSKEQLQLATIETALAILDTLVVEPAEAAATPLERLRTLYDRFLDYIEERVFPGGCFFASAESELGMREGRVKDRIAELQRGWVARVEGLVQEAQAAGELPADEDPAQVAFELDAYGMMGNVGFVLHDDPEYLRHARSAIHHRLR
ncbi:MAG TPA: TetR/AcrR family transcriptional regulator [Gaiellaceae bacterium]|nr:TetR/AcrR family transcriptional regulator [Gaiellaceae bacterium]